MGAWIISRCLPIDGSIHKRQSKTSNDKLTHLSVTPQQKNCELSIYFIDIGLMHQRRLFWLGRQNYALDSQKSLKMKNWRDCSLKIHAKNWTQKIIMIQQELADSFDVDHTTIFKRLKSINSYKKWFENICIFWTERTKKFKIFIISSSLNIFCFFSVFMNIIKKSFEINAKSIPNLWNEQTH